MCNYFDQIGLFTDNIIDSSQRFTTSLTLINRTNTKKFCNFMYGIAIIASLT